MVPQKCPGGAPGPVARFYDKEGIKERSFSLILKYFNMLSLFT